MWTPAIGGLLALVLAAQVAQTRGCRADTPAPAPSPLPSPSPPPSPTPQPRGEVFTTQDGIRFHVETVVESLVVPWAMAFAPDGRLFITERAGRVRILNLTSSTQELALTIADVFSQDEAGLLGLALDPQFDQNRWVYLYYSALSGGARINRVVRYREVNALLVERVLLLDNIPAAAFHDGGRLRFGPDGLLYITTGDATVQSLAQDLASYAGKVLRIARDGTTPRDNRFTSPIYSSGHRNPQGFDWHPMTGDLWASEHGSQGNDEVNVIRGGANYGWPRIEAAATLPGMESPVAFYNPAIAPSGASFYRGDRFPGFSNNLFIGTLRGSHLLRLRIDGRRIVSEERLLDGRLGRIRDVVSGPDGYLYLCTNNRDGRGTPTATDDRILRLVPAT